MTTSPREPGHSARAPVDGIDLIVHAAGIPTRKESEEPAVW
jgi:hypothetical protein